MEGENKNVWITEHVRVFGMGFAPSDEPVSVNEKIADAIVKAGCGSFEEPEPVEEKSAKAKPGQLSLVGGKKEEEPGTNKEEQQPSGNQQEQDKQ